MHLFLSIIALFIFRICEASNFDVDYPNITTCVIPREYSINDNPHITYLYLKQMFGHSKRCTHIYGNLQIAGLRRFPNGTDPDLRFLESIEEISGVVNIYLNSVKRIPLINLKVIRGVYETKDNFSLNIFNNVGNDGMFLEELDLRNLKVIMDQGVLLSNNPGLKYLEKRVDWNQILHDPSAQKILIKSSTEISNQTTACHSSCDFWAQPLKNKTQFCFGPTQAECQLRTKCASTTGLKWCNFSKTKGEIPCHYECSGGCYGKSSADCVACNKYFKNYHCTSTCAPNHKHNLGEDFTKSSKDKHTYLVGNLCTSQCPASLLDQNKICIFECDFKKYYQSGTRCLECPNRNCRFSNNKVCDLSVLDPSNYNSGRKYTLNKNTLMKLTNCTTILGQLDIDDQSFQKGVTIPLLYEHLKNVRIIFGELSFTFLKTKVTNLTFLPNLEEIRYKNVPSSIGMTLKIVGRYLDFLGLKNLKKVFGKTFIWAEDTLCYVNKIPWKEVSSEIHITSRCNKPCHPTCTNGCWGPDHDLCYSCAFLKAGDFCVKNCADRPGYVPRDFNFNTTSNNTIPINTQCEKCHFLCKENCTGPLPSDCQKQCRFALENDTCVKTCSAGYYPSMDKESGQTICRPCHKSCDLEKYLKFDSYACSGPSDKLGAGGCTMCHRIINLGKNESRCHRGKCPSGYYRGTPDETKDSYKRTLQEITCEPCNPLCKNCTNKGTHRNVCTTCNGYFFNNRCVSVCPNEVKNYTEKVEVGGACPRCHLECKNGCSLVNDSTTCHQCVHNKLFHDVLANKFSCVTHCPADRNYTEFSQGEVLCLTYAETAHSRQKKNIIFIIIGCIGCLAILLLLFVIYFKWRYNQTKIKAEIKALYSNYKEPIMKNMKEDDFSKPPNMKRLQMIPISDLLFNPSSTPLGSGAFGKVFRGYWKVPRLDNKTCYLDVVIKVIHNSSKASTDEFLEEAKIMASVSHRHCLPLIGVCLSLDKPCLVSTFAEHGSLDKYLHQYGKKISSYSMLKWSEEIADGMAYLNMRNIIHRDLAARNILVNSGNVVQITDFGLSRFVDDSEDSIVVKSGRVPIRWLALETLLDATYSHATDVWAYGVTLWEIFTYGKRPYEHLDTNEIKSYLQQGNRLYQPEISTLDVYMVLIKCWLDDPRMRPSFTELMETFATFAITPKRFLYLSQEHSSSPQPLKHIDSKEMFKMQQISIDSYFRQVSNINNKSDDTSWGVGINNDSAYNLISNPYTKDPVGEETVLPSRKKEKRNISLSKFKFDVSRLLSGKLHRASKSFNYPLSSVYESNKTTCTSFESVVPLYPQRSAEYELQPVNPQVAKIKKEFMQNGLSHDPSHRFENHSKTPERIFVDKHMMEESECLLATPLMPIKPKPPVKSPNLPPIDIPPETAPDSPAVDLAKVIEAQNQNSPDSGNSHNFDMDDYLVPSHISSASYYNLTPSPSSNIKHSTHLSESPLLMQHQQDYVDDGYLEPKKIDL